MDISARMPVYAQLNRFEPTQQVSQSNFADARGRVVDTDFASESASLTKNQIVNQAGVAPSARAHATPQHVLDKLV